MVSVIKSLLLLSALYKVGNKESEYFFPHFIKQGIKNCPFSVSWSHPRYHITLTHHISRLLGIVTVYFLIFSLFLVFIFERERMSPQASGGGGVGGGWRGEEKESQAGSMLSGSQMWSSISQWWDHDLSRNRQTLKWLSGCHWATQAPLFFNLLKDTYILAL